jgi:uncharacterized HAD superfamily protein
VTRRKLEGLLLDIDGTLTEVAYYVELLKVEPFIPRTASKSDAEHSKRIHAYFNE